MIHQCSRCGKQDAVTEAEHQAWVQKSEAEGLVEPGETDTGYLCDACYKGYRQWQASLN